MEQSARNRFCFLRDCSRDDNMGGKMFPDDNFLHKSPLYEKFDVNTALVNIAEKADHWKKNDLCIFQASTIL